MAEIPKAGVQYGDSKTSQPGGYDPLPAEQVEAIHQNSDVDLRAEAQHHTLGPSPTQASPGDHMHDGGTSPLLLTGVTLTGSRGGNAALPSIIQALVKLGATDQTTA